MPGDTGRYKLILEIDARGDVATRVLGDVSQQLQKTSRMSDLMRGAYERVGHMATNLAAQIPRLAAEMFQLGLGAKVTRDRFEAFAGGSEQARRYLDAFNRATNNAVPSIEAMGSAARLLQMDLVGNEAEMEQVAAIAVKLGFQTMSAGQRLSDFSLMLANQSSRRLDNFGISVGRVNKRIKELQKESKELSRQEAFKIAVLEEGQRALDTLGDTSKTAAVTMQGMQAAVMEVKMALGEMMVTAAESSGILEGLSIVLKKVAKDAEGVRDHGVEVQRALYVPPGNVESARRLRAEYAAMVNDAGRWRHTIRQTEEIERYAHTITGVTEAIADSTGWHEQYEAAINNTLIVTDGSGAASEQYRWALEEMQRAQDNAAWSSIQLAKALEEERQLMIQVGGVVLNLATQWATFNQNALGTAITLEDKRADILTRSEEKIAGLRRQGWATYKTIDEEGERLQLAVLEERLAEEFRKREKWDEDTTNLTKLRSEQSVATLQEQIDKQKTMLGSSLDGQIRVAGRAVDDLIAEEERRRDDSIAALNEQVMQQEKLQRQSLGRMLINTMVTYAEMKGVAPERILEMQIAMSKEYDLIDARTAESAESWMDTLELWADGAEVQIAAVARAIDTVGITAFDRFRDAIDAIPDEVTVTVRVEKIEQAIRDTSPGATIPTLVEKEEPLPGQRATPKRRKPKLKIPEIPMQHGFSGIVGPGFGGPLRALMGEVPEYVNVIPLHRMGAGDGQADNHFEFHIHGVNDTLTEVLQGYQTFRALVG